MEFTKNLLINWVRCGYCSKKVGNHIKEDVSRLMTNHVTVGYLPPISARGAESVFRILEIFKNVLCSKQVKMNVRIKS